MSKKERVFNVAFGVGIFGIVYAMFLNLFSPSYVTVAFTNVVTYATSGRLAYAGFESIRQGLTGRL